MKAGRRPDRILALALLAVVLAGGYLLAVRPLVGAYLTNRHAIAESRDLLARLSAIAAHGAAWRRQVEELRGRRVVETAYLQGTSETLAAAALQNRLKSAIQKHGGELQSVQALPATETDGFRRVVVRAQMTADVPALQKILYDLEAGLPFMFVDNLDVRVRHARRDTERAEPLEVGLEVYGYLWQGAK